MRQAPFPGQARLQYINLSIYPPFISYFLATRMDHAEEGKPFDVEHARQCRIRFMSAGVHAIAERDGRVQLTRVGFHGASRGVFLAGGDARCGESQVILSDI